MGALVLCVATPAAASQVITYRATSGTFDDAGPSRVSVDDTLAIEIIDNDPRRLWKLSVNYESPVDARTSGSLATLLQLIAGQVTPPGTANVGDRNDPDVILKSSADAAKANTQALLAALHTFLAASTMMDADVANIKKLQADVSASLAHLAAAASNSPSVQGPPFVSRTDQQASVDFADALQKVYAGAQAAVQTAEHLFSFAEEAQASRSLRFTVRQGYERVTVRVCSQALKEQAKDVVFGEPDCSTSSYQLVIVNPLGSLAVNVGVSFPIYIKQPSHFTVDSAGNLVDNRSSRALGPVQPTLFFAARHVFTGASLPHLGVDLGFGVGDRLGKYFSLGAVGGLYGISVGTGLFIDTNGDQATIAGATTGTASERTEAAPLLGAYIKVALSSDLWELFSRSAAGGAKNQPTSKPGAASSMPPASATAPTTPTAVAPTGNTTAWPPSPSEGLKPVNH